MRVTPGFSLLITTRAQKAAQRNSLGAFAVDIVKCFATADVISSALSPSHQWLKAATTTPL